MIVVIGNFLGQRSATRQPCETLSDMLSDRGFAVQRGGRHSNRLLRVLHMVAVIVANRARARILIVDVFSGPAFTWALASVLIASAFGYRCIAVLHGGALPEYQRRHPFRFRLFAKQIARAVSPSPYLAGQLTESFSNILVIPNPIDTSAYRGLYRHELTANLIWLRALSPEYRPADALQVVAQLHDMGHRVFLHLAGPDKSAMSPSLKALARSLGIAEYVRFYGPIPKAEVPRFLRRGGLFLNTSAIDNAPVTLVEAMATGLPIVSTDAGGIPHLVHHPKGGLLSPPGDISALASNVARLMEDQRLAAEISEYALSQSTLFDSRNVLDQWSTLILQNCKCSS